MGRVVRLLDGCAAPDILELHRGDVGAKPCQRRFRLRALQRDQRAIAGRDGLIADIARQERHEHPMHSSR